MSSTVLIVEDDQPLKEAMAATLSGAGLSVMAAADGSEALRILDDAAVDLIISDVQMKPMDGHQLLQILGERRPELPVVLMTAYGTIDKAVDAMKLGATDYLVKPFEAAQLRDTVTHYLERKHPKGSFIAADPASRQVFDLARRVAGKDVTVLLQGESGTGKEIVARYIHGCSQRAAGPFVAINCAAIPDNMLEAVLFGYEKGAFTGASGRSDGKFVSADNGSLLLDEISEMELNLQAKLLRVLQEREVEPLGARSPRELDVRVIATTNRSLDEEVHAQRFREDLYYRLNVFPLEVPPLRSRPLDILPLAEHFVRQSHHGRPVEFSDAAQQLLLSHPWPGNVRELQNAIERALVLLKGDTIKPTHLRLQAVPAATACEPEAVLSGELRAQETKLILDALDSTGGRKALAAERLGISPRTLRYKLAKMRAAGVAVPGQ